MSCKTCEYHDSFSGACCNADSEHVADFTMDDDDCEAYVEKLLPEFGKRVLIWAGAWEIAFRWKWADGWVWFDGKMTQWEPSEVTEWQELPEPPFNAHIAQCSHAETCLKYDNCDYYKYYCCDAEERVDFNRK